MLIKMTENEYRRGTETRMGVCISCGSRMGGIDPDQVSGHCAVCGRHEVMGFEEAIIEGHLVIREAGE